MKGNDKELLKQDWNKHETEKQGNTQHETPRRKNNNKKLKAIQMSLVTRKPVFGVSDQLRLKQACAAIETS